eukprot:SAG25_NODE_6126_length_586_cov_0.802875_1_plen_95_part_00
MHLPQWLGRVRCFIATSWPFAHVPAPVHSRSLVFVGFFTSYWVFAQALLRVPHTRSVVAVGAVVSYSLLVQTVEFVHCVLRWAVAFWKLPAGQV